MSNKFTRFKKCVKENGITLSLLICFRNLINKIFNHFIVGRNDTYLDSSSRILGIKNMTIGHDFRAGKDLWLEAVTEYKGVKLAPKIEIGNGVSLSDFNHIGAAHYIRIGNHVLFGSKCYVTDHNHGIYKGENQSNPSVPPIERELTINGSVIIDDNVWIGDNVVILPNVHIGYGTIIGANSIVSKDIPPNSIAVGSPAHVIKKYDNKTGKWMSVKSGV
ncbi:hypothetical protein LQE88_10255 [Acidaminococcus sp. NSJ-142]|uniref:hypothetical protein n=1 Tax=Acidaminococcus hominis TaxID=2897706 RepID=UPI001E503543|nr:hypothetical protein [Acidaminococcus hominis]MCD2436360.1 hypothetical protein [Acidaminococcus hominis]